MSGKKGKSGRKSLRVEIRMSAIADEKLPDIILKSAKAVNDFFEYQVPKNAPKLEKLEWLRVKAEIGSRFMLKAMPTRFEGEVKAAVFSMGVVTVKDERAQSEKPLEFKIGD